MATFLLLCVGGLVLLKTWKAASDVFHELAWECGWFGVRFACCMHVWNAMEQNRAIVLLRQWAWQRQATLVSFAVVYVAVMTASWSWHKYRKRYVDTHQRSHAALVVLFLVDQVTFVLQFSVCCMAWRLHGSMWTDLDERLQPLWNGNTTFAHAAQEMTAKNNWTQHTLCRWLGVPAVYC